MKRFFIGLLIGLIGGGVVGFGAGIFVYPFWFLTDPAMERLTEDSDRTRIAAGTFIHPDPSDPLHWGKGGVSLYREGDGAVVVHLHEDFEVGPGPRFHVYLVDKAEIANDDDFASAKTVDLGRLRAFKGSQVFPLPAGVDPADWGSVAVWCKEFKVLISPASLAP